MQKKYKPPRLPDGFEIWIGLIVGAVIGLILFWLKYPWWSYTLASVIAFLGFAYFFQLWTEEDRQYFKGMAVVQELRGLLITIEDWSKQIHNSEVKQCVTDGVACAYSIINELCKQKPTKMYGGVSQLALHIRRMALIEEYIDIQVNPRKAGDAYSELMTKDEQAFQGFNEEMDRMLERVNSGDIFNMTTNAELLRALRNLLQQNAKEKES